jgi:hypothetical protein
MAQGRRPTRSSKRAKESLRTLEAAEDDIGFAAGRFTVKGTDRSLGFSMWPRRRRTAKPSRRIWLVRSPRYGAHVREVEIDAQTGGLDLVRYIAVDDVGRAINPTVVDRHTAVPRRALRDYARTTRRVSCFRRHLWTTPCRGLPISSTYRVLSDIVRTRGFFICRTKFLSI